MSDRPTPETDAFSVKFKSICGSKAWVPTDICRRFERERDEAREELSQISEYGTEEINAAVELRQKLAAALIERDEARAWAERLQRNACQHSIRAENAERERDEARSQRNALAASLEYIASAGISARHCEDEAKKILALVFEKEALK